MKKPKRDLRQIKNKIVVYHVLNKNKATQLYLDYKANGGKLTYKQITRKLT